NQPVDHSENLYVYEITSRDIETITKKHAYTWVHTWLPTCSGDYCQNISYLEHFADQYKDKDMALVLISEEYSLKEIKQIASTSRYSHPIGIMKSGYFGYKVKKASQKLYHDLTKTEPTQESLNEAIITDEYFFKNGELVFKASDMEADDLARLMTEE
ncbi:MAG: hypothetical protein AB8F95_08715, partial [Bacteroidia bacterium]